MDLVKNWPVAFGALRCTTERNPTVQHIVEQFTAVVHAEAASGTHCTAFTAVDSAQAATETECSTFKPRSGVGATAAS